MKARATILAAAILVGVALAGGAAWWRADADGVEGQLAAPLPAIPDEALPIPPVPPRIAQGGEYETCLSMLADDPTGAQTYATSWQGTGGGEGAAHCLALARIALGEPAAGAAMLEQLARASAASAAARATVYAQAGQAWLIAGDGTHAFAAATNALSLSPGDPDLLIDHAVAAGNLERFQEALDDLTRALETDPHRTDAMVLRGAAWRHIGRLELAEDDIDRALLADNENAEALLERGILRQRRGDRRGARVDWERASTLAPDTATADLAEQNLALLEAGPERR